MDEDPRLTIDKYREIAGNSERTIDWINHFAPMTMALVYLELKGCRQECACELRIFDEFLDDIYEHYRDWDTNGAPGGKADFYELAGNGEQQYQKLPSDFPSFPPRTITIKSLGEAFDNDGYRHSLRYFTYDYDMERIAEIFRYLGRTKEEKEALRDALKWDIESFCDEGRKPRFLAQLDGMDFSSEEHAIEQGMEARYSRALLEISIQEKKVHELNKEISQLKQKVHNAEDMLPSSEYHDSLRNELTRTKRDLENTRAQLQSQLEAKGGNDTQEMWKMEKEDILVELLTPIFNNKSENAKSFAEEIDGREDIEIIEIVSSYMKQKMVTETSVHRKLWSILHAFKIYNAGESNWNLTLKQRI